MTVVGDIDVAAWARTVGAEMTDEGIRQVLAGTLPPDEIDEAVAIAADARDPEPGSDHPLEQPAAVVGGSALEHDRSIDGWSFVMTEPESVPAVWGHDDHVLWAAGEGLMLVGPEGVGKTTLAQQIVLARIGVRRGRLLDLPVAETKTRVLYIAADRPRQTARSLRRMLRPDDEPIVRERLIVWRGPLTFDLTDDPRLLAGMARHFEADTVVIDSLKDVALDLAKDDVGSRVNLALQELIAAGVEVLVLHHQRKAQAENKRPAKLADVYGSRWLTAGMGSVVCLWGDAGDPVVDLLHLKQPVEEIGPLKILHDHPHGTTTIHEGVSLEQLLAQAGIGGSTAQDAARAIYEAAKPKPADVERVRRRLEKLVEKGRAEKRPALDGTTRYSLREERA